MTEPRQPGRARRFFGRVLMTLGGIVLFFLLLSIVSALFFSPRVPRQAILEIDLDRGLVETVPEDPLGALFRRDDLSVRDVVEALRRAEGDDRVRGVVARLGSEGIGMAQAEEIRDAIVRFRATGKPALAFSETFGEFGPGRSAYYLASAFDEIHLQPSGDVGLAGVVAEVPFLAGAFDRFGIEPRMDHRHEYKDGLNILTEEEMTGPQREATTRIVTSQMENLIAGVAASREMQAARVRDLIDRGPYTADEALAAGLVDRLSYRDQVFDSVRTSLGGGRYLLTRDYLRRAGRPDRRGPTVALIFGAGAVQRGESSVDPLVGGAVMGSETVARAFRQAIEDESVRAIVFRVDSPGGSYVASDAIWRETIRAREAGKPVVVSMGNVAGSGGYFVAMGADRIVAQPSTITGSIGVFGGKILIRELTEELGVTWDDVQVGGNATMWSPVTDYTPAEWERLQALLDRIYGDFVSKVARGRGISLDSADAIARGRVWTGADAQRIGLVDELGGYDVALRLARELAGIAPDRPVRVAVLPRERSLVEMFLEPRPRRSYPAGVSTLLAGLAREAQRVGLLGDRGVLTMPWLPVVW
jgi:protease IV